MIEDGNENPRKGITVALANLTAIAATLVFSVALHLSVYQERLLNPLRFAWPTIIILGVAAIVSFVILLQRKKSVGASFTSLSLFVHSSWMTAIYSLVAVAPVAMRESSYSILVYAIMVPITYIGSLITVVIINSVIALSSKSQRHTESQDHGEVADEH